MKSTNTQLLTKGIFALAAVAIVGTTTAVYAVTNATTNNTSGYGNGSENAIVASQEFDITYATLSTSFKSDVNALVEQAKSQLTASGAAAADDFDSQFNASSVQLDTDTANASATFRSEVATALNSGESKDKFIDSFNRAKANYFNALDAAKNDFAATTSNLGHNANIVKDQFMNGFNSSRDMYGNKLEEAKNKFADRVTNNK